MSSRHTFHAALIVLIAAAAVLVACKKKERQIAPRKGNITEAEVRKACGIQCHGLPPPSVLPKKLWRRQILKMCEDIMKTNGDVNGVNIEDCFEYYEKNAPDTLVPHNEMHVDGDGGLKYSPFGIFCDEFPKIGPMGNPAKYTSPAVSNVQFAKLSPKDKYPKIIVCDMMNGRVAIFDPRNPKNTRVIAEIPNPAHATVMDLDKDGILDILVADLGSFVPTNEEKGSLVWLKGKPDGSYEKITLVDHLARASDVEGADFDGDGDIDLVVTCFGLTQVGQIIYLENTTTDWAHPVFEARQIDPRPGGIHVPVCDLNNDGKPDFIALIAQQYELVIAYTNLGGGRFKPDTIWAGPHPHWGSSGIQVVDMDGDGDLDVLFSNGDVLDDDIMQPHHGIQWLENTGTFPWKFHRVTSYNGCERAIALDVDGDGDMDIVACSFLPRVSLATRKQYNLEGVIWLENDGHMNFSRHTLELFNTGHTSIAAGDYDGDGKPDLVAGNFSVGAGAYENLPAPSVTVFHNVTPRKKH